MPKNEKPIILLLTKDLASKIFLRQHLEKEFFIIEKTEFEEAIETAETSNLDVVFIDDRALNAFELCFQLKKRKRLFTVPIILITSNLKKAYKEQALKNGFFDLLYIPLNEKEIFLLIDKLKKEKIKMKKVSSLSKKIKPQ